MWKKDETPEQATEPRREPPRETRERSGSTPPAGGPPAAIGRSIRIRGEVSGDEDLLIQGHVDGTVNLGQHAVTVGSEGEVKADITARLVTVEGRVVGDLTAQEQVILRGSARVEGDITAPRVVLEDGAQFRGGVDMGEPAGRGKGSSGAAPASGTTPPSGATSSSDTTSSPGAKSPSGSPPPSSQSASSGSGKGGDSSSSKNEKSRAGATSGASA
jgi:cytoskeletal protein CcmA (bactofilin family)